MRHAIWYWFGSKLQGGMVLPWWALVVRAVLFPLDFFYWRMSRTRGYQWQTDTWIIGGVTYTHAEIRSIKKGA